MPTPRRPVHRERRHGRAPGAMSVSSTPACPSAAAASMTAMSESGRPGSTPSAGIRRRPTWTTVHSSTRTRSRRMSRLSSRGKPYRTASRAAASGRTCSHASSIHPCCSATSVRRMGSTAAGARVQSPRPNSRSSSKNCAAGLDTGAKRRILIAPLGMRTGRKQWAMSVYSLKRVHSRAYMSSDRTWRRASPMRRDASGRRSSGPAQSSCRASRQISRGWGGGGGGVAS
ncbi:hypothetical protein BC831DRAFT_469498, partial [Entophlyctis helioformis]